jgi:hypothetical protein
MINIFTAAIFSLFYVSLYPVLRGQFVIYHRPAWSGAQAAAFVMGGVVVQGLFCLARRGRPGGFTLLAQVVAGLLYAAAIFAFPGSVYQS